MEVTSTRHCIRLISIVHGRTLLQVKCATVGELEEAQERGNKQRSVGATLMNAGSSRSHSVFTVIIERSDMGPDGEPHIRAGKLNLVDLAGSERSTKTGALRHCACFVSNSVAPSRFHTDFLYAADPVIFLLRFLLQARRATV